MTVRRSCSAKGKTKVFLERKWPKKHLKVSENLAYEQENVYV